jgi:D-alanine-D-alanine ligase
VKDLRRKIAVLMGGPSTQGSTIGVHIAKNAEEIEPAIAGSAKYHRELLTEEFVSGRELTIGILGDQALPILEIIPKGGFDNFTNKYPFLNPQAGGGAKHVRPAQIDEKKTAEVQQLALRAFRAVGGRDYGRVDVILSDSGEPFVLEVNTIPGITEASLLREAAAVAGIGYSDLFARIIALSRARAEGSPR